MSEHLPDQELQPDGVLWWTFRRQSRVGHLIVVLSGLGVWMATYAMQLSMVGGIGFSAAGGPEAIAARQASIPIATTVCWLWFSLAFMLGKGAPLLNVTLYPLGALLFGPYLTAWAVAGRIPPDMFMTVMPTSGRFVVLTFMFFAPGFLLSLLVLGVFLGVKTFVTGNIDAWEGKHMPDEWHELQAKIEDRK